MRKTIMILGLAAVFLTALTVFPLAGFSGESAQIAGASGYAMAGPSAKAEKKGFLDKIIDQITELVGMIADFFTETAQQEAPPVMEEIKEEMVVPVIPSLRPDAAAPAPTAAPPVAQGPAQGVPAGAPVTTVGPAPSPAVPVVAPAPAPASSVPADAFGLSRVVTTEEKKEAPKPVKTLGSPTLVGEGEITPAKAGHPNGMAAATPSTDVGKSAVAPASAPASAPAQAPIVQVRPEPVEGRTDVSVHGSTRLPTPERGDGGQASSPRTGSTSEAGRSTEGTRVAIEASGREGSPPAEGAVEAEEGSLNAPPPAESEEACIDLGDLFLWEIPGAINNVKNAGENYFLIGSIDGDAYRVFAASSCNGAFMECRTGGADSAVDLSVSLAPACSAGIERMPVDGSAIEPVRFIMRVGDKLTFAYNNKFYVTKRLGVLLADIDAENSRDRVRLTRDIFKVTSGGYSVCDGCTARLTIRDEGGNDLTGLLTTAGLEWFLNPPARYNKVQVFDGRDSVPIFVSLRVSDPSTGEGAFIEKLIHVIYSY